MIWETILTKRAVTYKDNKNSGERAAKPTRYYGCNFRSRQEARWAVFLRRLGVKWQFEPEWFWLGPNEKDGIAYLPDFYCPNQNLWIEVKPTLRLKPDEKKKADYFVLYAGINEKFLKKWKAPPQLFILQSNFAPTLPHMPQGWLWHVVNNKLTYTRVKIAWMSGRFGLIDVEKFKNSPEMIKLTTHKKLLEAYEFARKVNFN